MTKFYLKFDTMKDIVKAPESCSLDDALRIVCRSEEIAWIQLRRNEKKLLNDINLDKSARLRFHVLGENGKKKKRIQTREEKIFVLANDCLTGDPSVHDLSLNQDMNSICSNGCRIAKCMKEYFFYRKSYKGALNSTILAKCLYKRLWDDSPFLLKQLPGIGMVTAKALNSAGINSFETMAEADPRKIEIITGRKYPFGNHIKESLLPLPPRVTLQIEEAECKRQGKSKLTVTLTRLSQSAISSKQHYADMMVGSEEDNKILYCEKIRAEEFSSPYAVTIFVSCPQHGRVSVKADLIFEEYVGLDIHEKHVVTRETNTVMTRAHRNEASASCYTLRKEIYVIEDEDTSSHITTEEIQDLGNSKRVQSSMPSFDLLKEETGEDAYFSEPEEIDCQGKTEKMIFDHIRQKSKSFPALMTSKSMESSYQPLILSRKHTRMNQIQIDDTNFHGDVGVMMDSEISEASSKMTYPIEAEGQCHNISRNLSSITGTDICVKSTKTVHQQSNNCKVSGDIHALGCKRVLPTDSPISNSQDDLWGCSFETMELPKSNGDASIFIDLEPSEASAKSSGAISSSVKADKQPRGRNFNSPRNIIDLEPSTKCIDSVSDQQVQQCLPRTEHVLGSLVEGGRGHGSSNCRNLRSVIISESPTKSAIAVNDRPDNSKLFSNDSLEEIPIVGSKRTFASESNPFSGEQVDRQCRRRLSAGAPTELSFLGFKSVFSFLWEN